MEEEGGFGQMDDESFMEMLRSGEGEEYVFSPNSCLSSPSSSCCYSSSSAAAAQMLWFGAKEEEAVAVVHGVSQKSTDSSLSSLSSSPPSTTISSPKSSGTKKAASTHGGRGRRATTAGAAAAAAAARLAITKKPKTEASGAGPGTMMVRKEKLGERIMALQQLVSPFGKSDTASVLHEALGYIRFLHDQVQVLSSPYLQSLPSSSAQQHDGGGGNDLRSRGLCLVPVACTEHVARSNGADLWSPAVGNSRRYSSSSKH